MNARRIAIVLHGPPATGKSTLASLLQNRAALSSRFVSLDEGWGPGEIRRNGGHERYADIRLAHESILVIEIGCGEPMDLSFAGATRGASEWLDILSETGRECYSFLLSVEWRDARQRMEERFDGLADKLFWIWRHVGVHALYAHKDPMVTFSSSLGLTEHPIDMSNQSAKQAAEEVERIVGL